MKQDKLLSIFVVSCDKYSDLWDDMFNLLDRFWPNRPYETILVTDTKEYNRKGVNVIHFGNIREWMVCTRKALETIDTPYVLFLMEDYFIVRNIDTSIIEEDLHFLIEHKGDFINLHRKPYFLKENAFDYINNNIIKIPEHLRYGLDTAAAIWRKDFFLQQLYKEDGNAWRFEAMLVEEAASTNGLPGRLFCDLRSPINSCPVEVVSLGKFKPEAVRIIEGTGYKILSTRERMSLFEVSKEKLKKKLSSIKFGRKILKKIGRKLGFVFFTEG